MTLKLYNTLTKKKEVFKPINKREVKIYTCGPTAYGHAHIGNLRSFIFADLLKRYLEYKGYKIKHIVNITDIDDKTIKNSQKQKKSLKEFTEFYIKSFFKDIKILNIKPANKYPKATDHIKEMQSLIKKLLDKKIAYKSPDHSIYFDISKFKKYGNLANIEGLKTGARVNQDEYQKDQANDFALWKAWDKKDGNNSWTGILNRGRPGWHIECSAMSMKYLGNNFDIHTGGIDLIFPHHQNEIAQSEAATNKKFVNYWLHCEHLLVNNKKMSKSLNNLYTLKDLLNKNYDPMTIRYILLATHYPQNLNFTFKGLEASRSSLNRIKEFLLNTKNKKDNPKTKIEIKKLKKEFEKAMDNDLNISEALASIFNFIKKINKIGGGNQAYKQIIEFDKVLGLNLNKVKQPKLNQQIKKLIQEREKARKNKDYKKADKLRQQLNKKGIIIQDTKQGIKISY